MSRWSRIATANNIRLNPYPGVYGGSYNDAALLGGSYNDAALLGGSYNDAALLGGSYNDAALLGGSYNDAALLGGDWKEQLQNVTNNVTSQASKQLTDVAADIAANPTNYAETAKKVLNFGVNNLKTAFGKEDLERPKLVKTKESCAEMLWYLWKVDGGKNGTYKKIIARLG